jgi:hypothetical protein
MLTYLATFIFDISSRMVTPPVHLMIGAESTYLASFGLTLPCRPGSLCDSTKLFSFPLPLRRSTGVATALTLSSILHVRTSASASPAVSHHKHPQPPSICLWRYTGGSSGQCEQGEAFPIPELRGSKSGDSAGGVRHFSGAVSALSDGLSAQSNPSLFINKHGLPGNGSAFHSSSSMRTPGIERYLFKPGQGHTGKPSASSASSSIRKMRLGLVVGDLFFVPAFVQWRTSGASHVLIFMQGGISGR